MEEETRGQAAFAAYALFAIAALALIAWYLWSADVGLCTPGDSVVCAAAEHPNRFRLETIITAAGVIAVFGAGYFTYRRARAADRQAAVAADQVRALARQIDATKHQTRHLGDQVREQAKQTGHLGEQVKVANRQVDQRREEHVADRYGKAIEQIGSSNVTVRIGGLYAMEALAVDSAKRWASIVYDNLVAYLIDKTQAPDSALIPNAKIRKDVQVALDLLSRQRSLF